MHSDVCVENLKNFILTLILTLDSLFDIKMTRSLRSSHKGSVGKSSNYTNVKQPHPIL